MLIRRKWIQNHLNMYMYHPDFKKKGNKHGKLTSLRPSMYNLSSGLFEMNILLYERTFYALKFCDIKSVVVT